MTKKDIINAMRESRKVWGEIKKVRVENWVIWGVKTWQARIAWKWFYYAKRDGSKYQVGGWESQNDTASNILRIEERESQ